MSNAWGHFQTITKHRHEVIRNCFRAGIFWQGLRHDLSKYSLTEFLPGAKYYTGKRSPNELEREEYGHSVAWMHHKGRNRHHFEYWVDYNPKFRKQMPVKMPLRYVIEMFCDRVAASKIYMKEKYDDTKPLDYFLHGTEHRIIDPETSAFLEKLLVMLAEEGEDKTFAFIRQYRKTHQSY